MKARQFLKNTVILAVGAVVLRLIGIGFSGWLTRKIGSTGMGLFQLVFTIYNFASTLATSGIYLAVTRLVAEELGKGKYGRAAAAMRVSMVFGAVVSAGAAAFLWFGAPYIGVHILQDGRTVRSLRVLAAALPFMAFSCSLRGYFFAIRLPDCPAEGAGMGLRRDCAGVGRRGGGGLLLHADPLPAG